MSDPRPEVMFVDGGVVSRSACKPECTCNAHGVEPRPDLEAECTRLRTENERLWTENHALEEQGQRLADELSRIRRAMDPTTNPGTPRSIAQAALQHATGTNGGDGRWLDERLTAGPARSFKSGVPNDSLNTPGPLNSTWRGYALCFACHKAMTEEERQRSGAGICEDCWLAVPR